MAEIVVMPKLGLTMETGAVGAWRVAEGDQISIGMVIAEITTEKITYELEAQAEGVLLKIILPEDGETEVGAPIAVIGRPGEDISGFAGAAAGMGMGRAVTESAVTEASSAVTAAVVSREPGGRIVVSPAAKKLAAELGVELAGVAGTGPGGRITLEDIQAAAARPAAAGVAPGAAGRAAVVAAGAPAAAAGAPTLATPVAKRLAAELGVDLAGVAGSGPTGRVRAEDVARSATPAAAPTPTVGAGLSDIRGGTVEEIPYAGMRRMIGEHMDASRKASPTVTYDGLADVQELKQLLAQVNATRPDDDKINVTAAIVKAVALTLKRMPRFNATLDGDVIRVWRNINVGVAVALEDGLIVPVVREADRKSLGEIAREIRDLAQRARENKLLPDDVSGGTFTVSTLGPYRSVDWFSPIINQPEAAILGVGRMQDTVVAVNGEPVVHATMGLSLTCDHRVLDGAPAAQFLRTLMDYLAEPVSVLA